MENMISIAIRVLCKEELISYIPDEAFWDYRDLRRNKYWNVSAANDLGGGIHLAVIRIEFRNDSSDPIKFDFANTARKAEWLGLEVYDINGTRILPEGILRVRVSRNTRKSQLLHPHEMITCDLVGEIVGGWFIFPGAKYNVAANSELKIVFEYQGSRSNTTQLQLSHQATE
jgi:hypothetical protein